MGEVGKIGFWLSEEVTATVIVDSAKVMSKGQITLPKDIRAQLGIATGDRVTLVCEGNRVIIMNAAHYALKLFQQGMAGEAERLGLRSEEEADALVKEFRSKS